MRLPSAYENQKTGKLLTCLAVFAFVLSTFVSDTSAQNVVATWNKGGDGFWWTNPNQLGNGQSDWDMSGNVLPYLFPSTAITPTGFTYFDVEVNDGSNIIVPSGLPISISNLKMSDDSSIELIDGTDFLLVNAGDNPVNGVVEGGEIGFTNVGSNFLTEMFLDGNITFKGGGRINMSNSSSNVIRGNSAFNINSRMTLEDYTVEGAGNIGGDELIINVGSNGLINANTSETLTIDPLDGASSVFNTGTMQASSGGTLRLFDGGFDNTNGVIQALGTGKVELGNVTVRNGTLGGDGTIDLFGSTVLVGPITNNANFEIDNGHTATIDGAFINNNQIRLGSNSGRLLIANDLDLTGGGAIHMSDNANNVLSATSGSLAKLTNVDNTIRGSGFFGVRFVNTSGGIIRADQATPLFLQPQDGTPSENHGLIEAVNGGTLTVNIVEINNNGGLIQADGGTLQLTNSATITGGNVDITEGSTLKLSNGTLNSDLNNLGGEVRSVFGINNLLTGTVNNSSSGVLAVGNGSRINLNAAGSYHNEGKIQLEGTGPLASFSGTRLVIDGTVKLQGGGEIHMSNAVSNTIESAAGATGIFHNVDHRIHGAGHIGRNTTRIINDAVIEADQPFLDAAANGTIELDPGGVGGFVNNGVIRASNGGQITLRNGLYDNANGIIEAKGNSTIEMQQAVEIHGGTVRTRESGVLKVTGQVTLDGTDMNLDANTIVESPLGRLNLAGSISNRQSIFLDQTNLHFTEEVVLGGGGEVILSDDFNSGLRVFSNSGIDRLINEDNTISGAGSIASLSILNRGTIRADGQNNLIYQVPSTGFDNEGNLEVVGPGELHLIGGPFSNSGTVEINSGSRLLRDGDYVQTDGVTTVNGILEVTLNRVIDIQGGKLAGSGEIIGQLNLDGTVSVGNSVGILNLENAATISALFEIELENANVNGAVADPFQVNTGLDPAAIGFDQLNVFDELIIDNSVLSIDLLSDFQPESGAFFDVITADQLTLTGSLEINSSSVFEHEILTLFDASTGTDRDVLRLSFVAVPEPGIGGLGLFVASLLLARRKRNIAYSA